MKKNFSVRILILSFLISSQLMFAEKKPAILFFTSVHHVAKCIDLTYLQELKSRGFEVDYLEQNRDFSWERIKKYNCLVVFDVPYPRGHSEARPPIYREEFIKLIERYLKAGGGVLLMKANYNGDDNILPLLKLWGARIPLEILMEDPAKTVMVPRMNNPGIRAAYTENILPSPVSKGVRCIWFPCHNEAHYNGCDTAAIKVNSKWQVVYKGSPTSYTIPFKAENPQWKLPEDIYARKNGVKSPDLFAIREYQKGRIAFTSTWPTWTLGSGTAWLYERRFLTKGFNGKASDFQKLLDNTFKWLSAPSMKNNKLGGYVTKPERLLSPNEREEVKKDYAEKIPGENPELAKANNWKLFKGIFGAKSSYGGGEGAVVEWAAAAKKAGLDFLVFMDDFSKLTPAKLEKLKADCKKNSDDSLILYPGYSMKTNIGDNFFAYGPGLKMPEGNCLYKKNLLNVQYQDLKTGEFKIAGNPVLVWILKEKNTGTNFGYYRFKDPEAAMKMYDLRLYSVAALRTYQDGKKLEDVTEDFLTTVDATISPLPISVNLCKSPKDLIREVKSGNALTYAMAPSLDQLYRHALTWAHQYSGVNVFASDGPVIKFWPTCFRNATYASARFTPGRAFMPSLLWVTSDVGLKSVTIYDGPKVFRKFKLNGEKELKKVLELSGNLHRNLVLIAEDLKGGKAVSFPRRAYKCNTSASFCADHINDAGKLYLGRGPGVFRMHRSPKIFGGHTWDGGPKGALSLFSSDIVTPKIKSNLGEEGERKYANIPMLDFADEIANRYISQRNRSYADKIPAVNAWYSFGPTKPNKLINITLYYGEWHIPTTSPMATGWAAHCHRKGALPSLFETEITSLQDQTIEKLTLTRTKWQQDPKPLLMMVARKNQPGECSVIPLLPSIPKRPKEISIKTGDWFGFYSEKPSSGIYWLNRGRPIKIQIYGGMKGASVFLYLHGDINNLKVKAGEKLKYEMLAINYPVDVPDQGPARFTQLINYLKDPEGLKILEGGRLPGDGILELKANQNRVRFRLPKPKNPIDITLPVRVHGLNPNWSAGYLQHEGYAMGIYGDGKNKYTPLGFDSEGRVYPSMFPDMAKLNDIEVGHPIVCDQKDLIIQVTQKPKAKGQYAYYIAVNNPTDKPVTATLKQNMKLPGLNFADRKITVSPGGYEKIQ